MLVRHAFRLELDPSHRTQSALSSRCGASRYAFNWGLGWSRTSSRRRHAEALPGRRRPHASAPAAWNSWRRVWLPARSCCRATSRHVSTRRPMTIAWATRPLTRQPPRRSARLARLEPAGRRAQHRPAPPSPDRGEAPRRGTGPPIFDPRPHPALKQAPRHDAPLRRRPARPRGRTRWERCSSRSARRA